MLQKLHKNAKTNYSIRKEIKESDLSVSALAEKFNISWITAKKWKERTAVEDKSSRPDKIRTTLSEFVRKGRRLDFFTIKDSP